MKTVLLTAIMAILAFVLPACADDTPADRMDWFKQARFGMFIHWGIYSVPAGEWEGKTNYAEWFQLETKMPGDQYAKFAAADSIRRHSIARPGWRSPRRRG